MKKLFLSMCLLLASFGLEAKHLPSVEVNVESSAVHSLVPYIKVRDYKEDKLNSKCVLVGIGYRYIQDEGYNCRVNYSLFSFNNQKDHKEFSFENIYKFNVRDALHIYPAFSFHHCVYSFQPQHITEDSHFIDRSKISLGFGVDKKWEDKVTVGLKGDFFKDLSRMALSIYGKTLHGHKQKGTSGYKVTGLIRYVVTVNKFLEFIPYYSESFKDGMNEKGASLSFIWGF